MAQVTLYLDAEAEQRMRRAAKAAGLSMSAWLSRLVRERTASEWPEEVVELAGAWRDLPDADALRDDCVADVLREAL
ncbi:MAG: CopG family transcriptional regulator [Deltaproteobacteria bacterium]|nr:CopG family transcriptional regulator [Deltaproteobacteria bacterium]